MKLRATGIASLAGRAIFLITPMALGALLFFHYRSAYDEGAEFEKGLHVFGWIFGFGYFAPAALAAMAIIVLAAFAHRRQARKKIVPIAIMGGAAVLCCSLVYSPLMQSAFEEGRDRAYQLVDSKNLSAECLTLWNATQAMATPTETKWYGENDPGFQQLPEGILKIHPKDVFVCRRGVIVQMDGGGPAPDEGFLVLTVPLRESPDVYAKSANLKLLQSSPPVFMFRSDDPPFRLVE